MTAPPLALLAASALLGAGIASVTSMAASGHDDAAYAVVAVGDEPFAGGPSAFSTSVRIRADSGSARLADGGLAVGAARVTAGGERVTAVTLDATALGGGLRAATVTASCRNDAATSHVHGGIAGHPPGGKSVAHDGRTRNPDGSTAVTGLQILLDTGPGAVITIASATCSQTPKRNGDGQVPVERGVTNPSALSVNSQAQDTN